MQEKLEYWTPFIKELAMHEIEMDSKKLEYWNHFIERFFLEKVGGGANITGPRLWRIKKIILADKRFWFDVIDRHNGQDRTPEQMMRADVENYIHCLGNFWGMVIVIMDRHEQSRR